MPSAGPLLAFPVDIPALDHGKIDWESPADPPTRRPADPPTRRPADPYAATLLAFPVDNPALDHGKIDWESPAGAVGGGGRTCAGAAAAGIGASAVGAIGGRQVSSSPQNWAAGSTRTLVSDSTATTTTREPVAMSPSAVA
jgi:hypothetical protein